MTPDNSTFVAAFSALWLVLGALLWRFDRRAQRLEDRIASLEAAKAKDERRPGDD